MSKRDSRVLQIERTLRAAEGLSETDLKYVVQRLEGRYLPRVAINQVLQPLPQTTGKVVATTEDEPDPELGF